MAFVSVTFPLFVAVVTLLYFLVPKKCQWAVLLIASYVFFFLNSGWLVLILLFTTAVTYMTGRGVYAVLEIGRQERKGPGLSKEEKRAVKERTKKKARGVMLLGVCVDLGLLVTLKYSNFFLASIGLGKRGGVSLPDLTLLLPIGISFYTLQAVAYIMDIYRGKIEPDRSFPRFMLFMSYFPQIVQGPIARHNQLAHQLYAEHRFDYDRLAMGAQLFLWGWMKKLIIADNIAGPVSHIFANSGQYGGLAVLIAAMGYSIQIYTDFSGGMDIARGVSQVLGIELELNFMQPFFSLSIEEFWRRWHITLGGWMRDYVFYPLSLSKRFSELGKRSRKVLGVTAGKKLAPFLAMFIVYFLVGIWHGAEWKYVGYGLWNGLFIATGILMTDRYAIWREKLHIREENALWRCFRMARTFFLCSLGRFFVGAADLPSALNLFRAAFRNWGDLSFLSVEGQVAMGVGDGTVSVLLAAVVILFAVDYLHERGVKIRQAIAEKPIVIRWMIYYGAILALVLLGAYGPGYDNASFIYEQF